MPNLNSNNYTVIYVTIMTVIVAVCLALAATGLREKQAYNVELSNKKDILKAVNLDDAPDIEATFDQSIEKLVVDVNGNVVDGVDALKIDLKKESKKPVEERNLPVFIYNNDGNKSYILPVRGFGLWDAIWGYVALGNDLNTVQGVAFDHTAETPGLGAEIKDNPSFGKQFEGKKIFDEGEFVSVEVTKNAITEPEHQVASISGATMTSDGVSNMLKKDLGSYLAYIKSLK